MTRRMTPKDRKEGKNDTQKNWREQEGGELEICERKRKEKDKSRDLVSNTEGGNNQRRSTCFKTAKEY